MKMYLESKRGLGLAVLVHYKNGKYVIYNYRTGRKLKMNGSLRDGYVKYKGVKYYTRVIWEFM